jgi:4-hydroxy-3-polyprenylbenzoate decarboxylase
MTAAPGQLPIYAEADFCISGRVDPDKLLPEGPFGDHLGYYSLAHDFPVLRVERCLPSRGAIWPFTVVGRPPQEDTMFGELIHELTGPIIPTVFPACRRCTRSMRPACIRCCWRSAASVTRRSGPDAAPAGTADAGQCDPGPGQMSLAKYLLIVARRRRSRAGHSRHPAFFAAPAGASTGARPALPDLHHDRHARLLRRRAERRLEGGDRRRRSAGARLPASCPSDLQVCPTRVRRSRVCLPGVLAVKGPRSIHPAAPKRSSGSAMRCRRSLPQPFPLIVAVDDSDFAAHR